MGNCRTNYGENVKGNVFLDSLMRFCYWENRTNDVRVR